MVEMAAYTLEIADAVAVAVGERARIHLVDDGRLPPRALGEGIRLRSGAVGRHGALGHHGWLPSGGIMSRGRRATTWRTGRDGRRRREGGPGGGTPHTTRRTGAARRRLVG